MDGNGTLNSVFATTSGGQKYLRINIVAQDIPPTNAVTPKDMNGVWDKVYDAATNSIRVTGV